MVADFDRDHPKDHPACRGFVAVITGACLVAPPTLTARVWPGAIPTIYSLPPTCHRYFANAVAFARCFAFVQTLAYDLDVPFFFAIWLGF